MVVDGDTEALRDLGRNPHGAGEKLHINFETANHILKRRREPEGLMLRHWAGLHVTFLRLSAVHNAIIYKSCA